MTAKILVVDDSITIQKIVAMAFENEDASVEGIGDGSKALARLNIFHPDIVLADVDMPGLNGFELSREIKESSKLSVPVLLLASDFEEFDENLFRASLADDHITKPFKSEDLVQNVMKLLNSHSPNAMEEEAEEEGLIKLSSSHRVDEDVVIELGKNQLMDTHAGLDSEEEEEGIELDLPDNHPLTGLDENKDTEQDELAAEVADEKILSGQLPEEDPPVDIAATVGNPSEMELTDPEGGLEELLMRVEELSRKSEEISDNGQELSRMKAIDEMLNEVNALKGEPFFMATENENNIRDATESQLSPNPTASDAVIAEADHARGENNAEVLETTSDEITNAGKYPAIATEPSKHQESISPEDAVVTKSENPLPTLDEEPIPSLSEEKTFPSKEKTLATGEIEENIEKFDGLQLPQEAQLNQLIGTEVRRLLQQSMTALIEKEISGLSEKIIRTVEENVRKITPDIAKAIIEKEIDKIKTDG